MRMQYCTCASDTVASPLTSNPQARKRWRRGSALVSCECGARDSANSVSSLAGWYLLNRRDRLLRIVVLLPLVLLVIVLVPVLVFLLLLLLLLVLVLLVLLLLLLLLLLLRRLLLLLLLLLHTGDGSRKRLLKQRVEFGGLVPVE